MEPRSARCRADRGIRVALQAQQVYGRELQHMGIGSAVRNVARLAAFRLHRVMLEHIRSLLVRMACEADGILRCGCTHLLRLHRSVDIVAIAALDQAFVHAMVERHVELGLLLQVAAKAKFRLALYQQEFFRSRVMR